MAEVSQSRKIQFAFSRPRFAGLVVASLFAGAGLLGVGLWAGMEAGAAQANARPRNVPAEAPMKVTQASPALVCGTPSDSPDTEQYVVQAGSFLNRAESEKLTADLVNAGYSAEIVVRKDQTERNWFVVLVGPYYLRAVASRTADELSHLRGSAPIVRAVAGLNFAPDASKPGGM